MPKKKEIPIPTTFQETKEFSLDILVQRTHPQNGLGWWSISSTSTLRKCLEILKRRSDGELIMIIAEYTRGARGPFQANIGKGTYRKRGAYGELDLETVETEGAMVDLVEKELTLLKQEQEEAKRAAEEAARTYPCDYPGCFDRAFASLGPSYSVTIQTGTSEHTIFFYGCEGRHHEVLKHPEKLSLALGLPRSVLSPIAGTRTASDTRLIDLVSPIQDKNMSGGPQN